LHLHDDGQIVEDEATSEGFLPFAFSKIASARWKSISVYLPCWAQAKLLRGAATLGVHGRAPRLGDRDARETRSIAM